jgi:hypothetical protein
MGVPDACSPTGEHDEPQRTPELDTKSSEAAEEALHVCVSRMMRVSVNIGLRRPNEEAQQPDADFIADAAVAWVKVQYEPKIVFVIDSRNVHRDDEGDICATVICLQIPTMVWAVVRAAVIASTTPPVRVDFWVVSAANENSIAFGNSLPNRTKLATHNADGEQLPTHAHMSTREFMALGSPIVDGAWV